MGFRSVNLDFGRWHVTKEQLIKELAGVLNEDSAILNENTPLESLAGWDSTGLLGVIALLDGDLGVSLDVDRLRQCKTVGNLVELCAGKLE